MNSDSPNPPPRSAPSPVAATQPAIQPAIIERDELRQRLERHDPLKLLMAVSEWGFRVKHIPGSLRFKTPAQMFAALKKDEPIVVYCSNVDCHASQALIQKLREHGYTQVRHYSGGLIDWEGAGLPVEGDWAESSAPIATDGAAPR